MNEDKMTCEGCKKPYEQCVCTVHIRNWESSGNRIGIPDNRQLNEARSRITTLELKIAVQNHEIRALRVENQHFRRRINELEQEKRKQF